MNTHRASVKGNQNMLLMAFLTSIYCTIPFGMFLTACNFLFESVRKYYFNWLIVVLPTLFVLIVVNIYEMYKVYKINQILVGRKRVYLSKSEVYRVSKQKLITN